MVAAASQNRPGFECAIERSLPMLIAREMNDMKHAPHRIELWNNIGSKIDDSYHADHRENEDRAAYSARLLEGRYSFMRSAKLIDEHPVELIADDSKEFSIWTQSKIGAHVESGQIYQDKEIMLVCNICNKMVGVHTGQQTRSICQTCKTSDHRAERRTAWFMNIDKTPPNILLPRKAQHIASHARNVACRTWIERNRTYGTALDIIDSDHVLDPKLGISLMPGYLAHRYDVRNFVIIQGRDTLYNTAPYTQTLTPELQIAYMLSANVPRGIDREWVSSYGATFMKRYLPLFSIDRTTDITPTQMVDLKREYDNAVSYIDKMQLNSRTQYDKDTLDNLQTELNHAMTLFEQCRVRDSIVTFRNTVVRTMGANGLFKEQSDDDPSVARARERVSQIYGEL